VAAYQPSEPKGTENAILKSTRLDFPVVSIPKTTAKNYKRMQPPLSPMISMDTAT
jgi:hypothetical protein